MCDPEFFSDEEDEILCRALEEEESDGEVCDALEEYESDENVCDAIEDYEENGIGCFWCRCDMYRDRESVKMGVRERQYKMRIEQLGGGRWDRDLNEELTYAIYGALKDLIIKNCIPFQDRVYFGLSRNRLGNSLEYRGFPAGEWIQGGGTVNDMLGGMARTLNSNENFKLDDSFQLTFTQVRSGPRGRGKRKLKPGYSEPEKFKTRKGSVIRISNRDNLCAARAIVTAKARIEIHEDWNSIRQGRNIQKVKACSLHREVGIPLDVESCGYKELDRFAHASSLREYRLLLIDETRGQKVTAFGSGEKEIVILYSEEDGRGHYDVVTSLPGSFGTNYFCKRCLKGYDKERRHACRNNPEHCHACQQEGCVEFRERDPRKKPSLHCQDCNRFFYGQQCLLNHLRKSQDGRDVGTATTYEPPKKKVKKMDVSSSTSALPVCQTRKKCKEYKRLLVGLNDVSSHKCGYGNCPSCGKYEGVEEHKCFVQKVPVLKKKEDKKQLLVFFDIEARQDEEKHVANLLIAEREDVQGSAVFKGEGCVKEFLLWLDGIADMREDEVTVIAHNLQGYDGYFIMDEYHSQHRIVKQLRNVAKLLQIRMNKIRFIDSLSFFQMPLSAFPDTFGLEELKKGFFPHLFNTKENQEYVGAIPEKKFFMPETMAEKKVKEFEAWYQKEVENGEEYNFAKELEEYCRSDVKLLKEGCLTFKNRFETITGFNPFEHITIASACSRDLRSNRMIENTIASEPLHG